MRLLDPNRYGSTDYAPAPTVVALQSNSQCLPVSELLIIRTLATAKPRAEPGADLEHFNMFGAF